jgi:hypothetical protein
VVGLLLFRLYPIVDDFIPKEQVVDYHSINVTLGMLDFIDNRDQLAVVIGHEIGHIILGHTMGNTHEPENEYKSDMIGMFLAHKAGYSLCGMDTLWRRMGENYMSLHTGSHPNAFIRSYYSEMPECKGKQIKKEFVSVADAYEVYTKMIKNVEGKIRYKSIFQISPMMNVNAFVYTVTKDKK